MHSTSKKKHMHAWSLAVILTGRSAMVVLQVLDDRIIVEIEFVVILSCKTR
jgi:hypothetical protein